ncbi:pyridoxal phosphate-dependent aminotransferase [Bryobacter aggregatus]|uniref:pyridoxal phosphate-dependent aminotransferase n=1 Tax=Bryobacter aggregatus TaxID=360054 RepID=UPI0009B5C07E|nr:aminotransferase class I/II-fold pyridoxal phosphate-dependent enzyme [Bryobacter aggregatus]
MVIPTVRSGVQQSSNIDRRPRFASQRTGHFVESVIREMSRLAIQHGAVNLAQGFPDFPAPASIKQAAIEAIDADINQYSVTWGAKPLRDAIARKYQDSYQLPINPDREITVTCGATEAMIATLLATTNPGDEVIVFEPFYENYFPDTQLCGATRKLVTLHAPDWSFDPDELRRAFSAKTKAIILNTPNNPTGRVFTLEELTTIAELCQEFDTLAITDEIYEHILYDGLQHIPLLSLPGMRERTVLINSMSKTYSVTGWRVGWTIAAPDLTESIRKVHDFLTVGAASPLQQAGVHALASSNEYYAELSTHYGERRDLILDILSSAGFKPLKPQGAYYVMAEIKDFRFENDRAFARHLVEKVGVSCVPGSSFFETPGVGDQWVRFCFCKKIETLEAARERLQKWVA